MPKYLSILYLLFFSFTLIHAEDWQQKLTKVKEILKEIEANNIDDVQSINVLDSEVASIINNLTDLQKQIVLQKGRIEQEDILIRVLDELYSKEKSLVLETTIAELEKGLEVSKEYFEKVQEKKIIGKFSSKVKKYREEWEQFVGKLKKLKELTTNIKDAYEKLKTQTLRDSELEKEINAILSLISAYTKYVKENSFANYSSTFIEEWKQQLELRLERSIYASKVNVVRNSYQEWKDIQIQNKGYDEEWASIVAFQEQYNHHQEMLKAGSENKFFETSIVPLNEEANTRKISMEKEKGLSESVTKLYGDFQKIKDSDNPKNIMSVAEATKKQVDEYQKLILENKITSYYRKDITPLANELDKAIFSIKQEIDTFSEIEKEYQNFKNNTYTDIQDERKAIDNVLIKVNIYAALFQAQQIKGYLSQKVKTYTQDVQTRQQKVISELNIGSSFETSLKSWEEKKSWSSAQDEKDSITKLLSVCENYLSSADKISNYYKSKVEETQKKLTTRLAKITKEEEIFSNLEAKHKEGTSKNYIELQEEQKSLQEIINETEKYISLATENKISQYQNSVVNKWKKAIQERQQILNNEVNAYQTVSQSHKNWKSAQKTIETEQKHLKEAIESSNSYNDKIAKFEITRYYQKEVMALTKELKDRTEQIEAEQKLFDAIQEVAAQKDKQNLEIYQEGLKKIEQVIKNYHLELQANKISNYYATQVQEIAEKNKQLVTKLNEIATSFKEAKSLYSGWKNTSRWQSLEEEEKEINKFREALTIYESNISETNIDNSYGDEIEEWKKNINEQTQKLTAEKELFESLKKLSDNDGVFSSADEDKEQMDKIVELCDKHSLESRRKVITDHYQRSVRLRLKRAQEQITKIKKEKSDFKQVEISYSFWKNSSPWQNVEDEKIAVDKVIDKIQTYNDNLQFRRITNYYEAQVKEYNNTMKNRQLAIAQSQ